MTRTHPPLPPMAIIAALALTVLAPAWAGGCDGCRGRGGDATVAVPADAVAVIVAPDLTRLRTQTVAFLAGIEGASGAIDLIRARFGVDLAGPEGLADLGLDPSGNAALFATAGGEAVGLAVAVSDAEPFLALVGDRATKGAGATLRDRDPAAGAAGPAVATGPGWQVAWGMSKPDLGLVVAVAGGDGDAGAQWRAVAASGGGYGASPAATRARELAGPEAALYGSAVGRPEIPTSWGLGAAAALVVPLTSGLEAWAVGLQMSERGLTLRADGISPDPDTPANGAVAWFQTDDGAPLSARFPKAQTAFVRVRLEADRLRKMPRLLRKTLLPERLGGPLGDLLPPTDTLLELLDGDVAVSLLGLSESATVDHFIKYGRDPEALFQYLHAGLAVRVTDPAAAAGHLDAAAERLTARPGWGVSPISQAGWRGYSFTRESPHRTWNVLRADDVLMVLSGKGEVQRVLDVAQGSALPLDQAADSPTSEAALKAPGTALGAYVSFRRVTRELAEKGLPPYFLKMINDIRSISAAVTPREGGVGLTLDVAL